MTEQKYLDCPVCGANDWKMMWCGGECLGYLCKSCGTTIPVDRINDRAIRWVPVEEKLPGDRETHWCRIGEDCWPAWYDTHKEEWFEPAGNLQWKKVESQVTHWQDDKTWEEKK